MQTKKRAKPVKFGKTKEEKVTKEIAADINSDESKEIKKIIEEKTHPKEEEEVVEAVKKHPEPKEDEEVDELEEKVEDKPAEVRLSDEPDEKKEKEKDSESNDKTKEADKPDEKEKKDNSEETTAHTTFGSFTNEEVSKPKKKGYFGFFLLVAGITFLVGLVVIVGASYLWPSETKHSLALPAFVSDPTPTTEPSATPTPEKADLTAYSIRVLNGSGITGEAAKVKTLLEGKSFEIASVGNAATSDYTKTVISATKKVDEAYLNELIKSLQNNYSVNSVVEDAPSSQTADVVVTVGSDTAK